MLEIERRFVARASAELLRFAHRIELRQGYLTRHDAATVRVRQEGAAWVLAVKLDTGTNARVRHEIEVDLPEEDGRLLLEHAVGGTVEKTRHVVGRWEIDVYSGRFEGLVLAEVELLEPDEELPEVVGGLELIREITDERGLSSRSLAALGEEAARALVARVMPPA